jgi:hypothetical protein
MGNVIKILCSSRKCGKCRKMINCVKEIENRYRININIEIIDNIDEMIKFNTWILPTLIINEKIISRGYTPDMNLIIKHLKM